MEASSGNRLAVLPLIAKFVYSRLKNVRQSALRSARHLTRESIRRTLTLAGSLMDERPDSSYAILKSLQPESIKRQKEKSLYALLLTQATDKNYIDQTEDSLIMIAVKHFSNSRDDYHRMLSYYYLGRICYYSKDYPRSVSTLLKAEEAAKDCGDDFQLGMIYGTLSDIHNEVYNGVEELEYSHLSCKYFSISGRQPYLDHSYLSLARAYHNLDRFDESIRILDSVLDSAVRHNDNLLYTRALNLKMSSLYGDSRFSEVVKTYHALSEYGTDDIPAKVLRYVGLSYLNMNQLDSAMAFENRLQEMDSTEEWLSFELFERTGRFEEAYRSLRQINDELNAFFKTSVSQSVTYAVDYHRMAERDLKDREFEQESKQRNLTIVFLCVLSFFLIVLIRLKSKDYQRRIGATLSMASNLTASLDALNLQNDSMHKAIDRLFRSQFETIDKYCRTYYEFGGVKKDAEKIYKDVLSTIEHLTSDKRTMSELEAQIDIYYDGLLEKFRSDHPRMNDSDYNLFIYIVAGFSPQAMSLFLKAEMPLVYKRKSRLKERIIKADSRRKELYLRFF